MDRGTSYARNNVQFDSPDLTLWLLGELERHIVGMRSMNTVSV